MKRAYVFPGQGSQFPGMGKNLFDNHPEAKKLFEDANRILGFDIAKIMFNGSEEDLKQTKVTQPAIFIHSIVAYQTSNSPAPDMVAGHSLGEFTALVANEVIDFESALRLVAIRAAAMPESLSADATASSSARMSVADVAFG